MYYQIYTRVYQYHILYVRENVMPVVMCFQQDMVLKG